MFLTPGLQAGGAGGAGGGEARYPHDLHTPGRQLNFSFLFSLFAILLCRGASAEPGGHPGGDEGGRLHSQKDPHQVDTLIIGTIK